MDTERKLLTNGAVETDSVNQVDVGETKLYHSRRLKAYTSEGYQEATCLDCADDIASSQTEVFKPNYAFADYRREFEDLIEKKSVRTEGTIVTLIQNHRSTRLLGILKIDDQLCYVKQWDVKGNLLFAKEYGGKPESFLKMISISQTDAGDLFCVPYYDNGKFFLSIFNEREETHEVFLNGELGLDEGTMPNESFQDPYSVCAFTTPTKLFVTVFHQPDLMHHHCFYDLETRQVTQHISFGGPEKGFFSLRNFPQKAFYDPKAEEIYTFYRQGQIVTCACDDLTNHRLQLNLSRDIGLMEMFNHTILITRNSKSIVFIKRDKEPHEEFLKWEEYHRLEIPGFVNYAHGNDFFQIADLDYIYLYRFDENFMPVLDGVISNWLRVN
jgi:hypothetical protein